MSKYEGHYELVEALSSNPRIIEAPPLYNIDPDKLHAAIMDRLAQPLPSGKPSPFSSQAPGSFHDLLMAQVSEMLVLFAHELNLMLEWDWVQIFAMLGVEIAPAEYPIIKILFVRQTTSFAASVPVGTRITSSRNPEIVAITQQEAAFDGASSTSYVSARLNRLGTMGSTRVEDFTVFPSNLVNIQRVVGTEIVSEGREKETLVEAMLRAREGIRTGNLGRYTVDGVFSPDSSDFMGRCVTVRDYEYWVRQMGASKVKVLPRFSANSGGKASDLTTLAVYPLGITSEIEGQILKMTLMEGRLSVINADIIPIDGTISLSIRSDITTLAARNLAAIAISSEVNPPHGFWGDQQYLNTLATALEKVEGIYAVKEMSLKRADTDEPFDEIKVNPWSLFEIQDSIEFKVSL